MSVLSHISVDGSEFKDLRARHAAFWRRDHEGFLEAVNVFAPSIPSRLPQPDGSYLRQIKRLTPDMIDPDALIEEALAWDPGQEDPLLAAKAQVLTFPGVGDLMPYCRPFFKIPWLEAMLGCPITMTEGQIWVQEYQGDPEDLIARGANLTGNPWLELYVEFIRKMQDRLVPPYLASTNTLLRGPSDLVAAILGVKKACMGWIQEPRLMERLMRVCTDANLAIIEVGYGAIKPFRTGYMSGYGVWAPEPIVRMQADHSTLLSPQMYERQILPYDREVIRACPMCLFHIHNNGYHIAHLLVQVDELDAVEVVVDPYPRGARKAHEIEMMQMIQEHKALMLDVSFPSYEESQWVLAQLDKRGLYFNTQFVPDILDTLPEGLPGSRVWLLR